MNPFHHITTMVFSAVFAATLFFQAPGPVEASEEEEELLYVMEEVVVTAQKQEENLQEVPIAIQAFIAEDLEVSGVRHLGDLDSATPGLTVNSYSSTQPDFSIRGIRHDDFTVGTDPAVGIYLDGVYAGRSGSALMNLSDIERIEVLKGPQGALFGRNATAGAINVITKKPTEQIEGSMLLRYGNYNKRLVESVLNVPVLDNLFFRANGQYSERDGFYENQAGGDDLDTEGNRTMRGSLLWTPGKKTEILFSADYDDTEHDGTHAASLNPNLSVGHGDAFGDIANDVVESKETRILEGYTLNGSHRFDLFTFTSITSYREFDTGNREDSDGLADFAHYLDTCNIEKNRQFYQELRLSGKPILFQWFLGASYHQESARQTHQVTTTTDSLNLFLGAPILPTGLYWQESMINEGEFSSIAGFGDLTWHITDRLDVTVGLRYSRDEKEFLWIERPNSLGMPFDVAFPLGPDDTSVTRENTWENWSPRLTLGYDLTPDVFSYFSAARGYKAGGFGGLELNSEYDSETVTNYEMGVKSQWLDNTLRINGSLFSYKYKNRQILSYVTTTGTPPVPIFRTITSDMKGRGAELEMAWMATRKLSLSLNGGYYDINRDDFATVTSMVMEEPTLQVVTGLDYQIVRDNFGIFKFHMDYSHTRNKQKEIYGNSKKITNGRLTWAMMNDLGELSLWVKNLFDEKSISRYNDSWQSVLDTTFIARDEPRTVGLDYRYLF
ncbi:MAG: TonB-dependent receptor [Proteobacteria bacterium]|nr:TonB-dependent receptor [Pseudomonadota bacterium]MBU1708712.1 TonB-dependent receptor [Pseudomonadota bacterium]